jgi:hypothetical protein
MVHCCTGLTVLICAFVFCTGCGPLDPVLEDFVYQGKTEQGILVSLRTTRCSIGGHTGHHMSSFVIAQPEGTLITLDPVGESPENYAVQVTSADGHESIVPLTLVYRDYCSPDASIYKSTLLPRPTVRTSGSTDASSKPGGP